MGPIAQNNPAPDECYCSTASDQQEEVFSLFTGFTLTQKWKEERFVGKAMSKFPP